MKTRKSWGICTLEGIERAMYFECPTCGWDVVPSGATQRIVGFCDNPNDLAKPGEPPPGTGALIYHCPQCQTHFWIYVEADARDLHANACHSWPEEPS